MDEHSSDTLDCHPLKHWTVVLIVLLSLTTVGLVVAWKLIEHGASTIGATLAGSGVAVVCVGVPTFLIARRVYLYRMRLKRK